MSRIERYLHTYERIRENANWWNSRFVSAVRAALLVIGDAEERIGELPEVMRILEKDSNWFDPMVVDVIAALVITRGVDPSTVSIRAQKIRSEYKRHGLTNVHELGGVTSSAWLALFDDSAVERALPRIARIMRLWKADHPWITGNDDLHIATLHALGPESPESICRRTEDYFQALQRAGDTWSDQDTQRTSQLVAFWPGVAAAQIEENYRQLRKAVEEHMGWKSPRARGAVGLLAAATLEPKRTIDELMEVHERLRKMRWVDEPFQLTISAGFMIADRLEDSDPLLENTVLTAVISTIVTRIATAHSSAMASF